MINKRDVFIEVIRLGFQGFSLVGITDSTSKPEYLNLNIEYI